MIHPITIQGRNFIEQDTGRIWKYVGYGYFAGLRRWLADPSAEKNIIFEPVLQQIRDAATEGGYHGPIVLRVFRYAQPSNQFSVPPWSYDFNELRKMTEFCGERDFHIDWTCGDSQIVMPSPDPHMGDQDLCQRHLHETTAHLVDLPGVFVETCNQPFKNGIDVSAVKPHDWGTLNRLITDSGKYYEGEWDTSTDLQMISYHGSRETRGLALPFHLGEMRNSAVYLSDIGKPYVFKEPIGADEVEKPGSRYSDPSVAYRIGQVIAFCSGVTFHNSLGFTGDGYDHGPNQRACAVAYFAGIASVVHGPKAEYAALP